MVKRKGKEKRNERKRHVLERVEEGYRERVTLLL